MHLQGDMHTHTIASTHAYSTITENCQWAAKYGMKGIAMTDHAMKMPELTTYLAFCQSWHTAEKDKRDNRPQRHRG